MASSVLQQVQDALNKAERAVIEDQAGHIRESIMLYRDSASILTEILSLVCDEQASILTNYIQLYDSRAAFLEDQESQSSSKSPSIPTPAAGSTSFQEDAIPSDINREVPPAALPHRPYWLMRLLSKTIMEGGHLTSRIFIPRCIWQQEGAKLVAVGVKCEVFETLMEQLSRLSQMEYIENYEPLLRELDSFTQTVVAVQHTLARNFSFISEPNEERKVKEKVSGFGDKMKALGNSLAKGATRLGNAATKSSSGANNSRYFQLACQVMEKAQFLENWLSRSETDGWQLLSTKLMRIGDFFYAVLCALIMRDITVLLERNIRKSRKSFARLYPK
eukprot:GILI01030891.1.p1 GENE.GILI01030891.1~~GILI01030891.1.p1  ORF type:complete len:333 (-),score=57.61 GILI01030891.1:519-1517(-)